MLTATAVLMGVMLTAAGAHTRPRAGYAVAIFGSCSAVQLARMLTTVSHLRTVGTQFPIVAMVARSCAEDTTLREMEAHYRGTISPPRVVPFLFLAGVNFESARTS